MARFTTCEQKEGTDGLIYPTTCYQSPSKKSHKSAPSVTAEFPVQSSGMTSSDKSSTCVKNILKQRSFKTLDQESTSSVEDCRGYWDEQCKEISSHLWLPTEIAFHDLGQTSSNGLSSKTVENSWFSTRFHCPQNRNLLRICLPSSTSSPVGCMDSENTVLKSRKIRVYPTSRQREILRQWFGVSRYVYNQTIAYLKKDGTIANWMAIKKWLLPSLPEWAKDTPYQIKAIAVKDACQTVKLCKRKFRETHQFNEAKFRRRHNKKQSVFIPNSALKVEHGIYYTLLGDLKSFEPYPKPDGDCRLVYQSGRWFISVPMETTCKSENQGRIVAIDPGVRTFATFYSPNSCGKLGCEDFSRVQRLCYWLDDLISRMSKACRRQRYKMRKAADRMRWRIRDLIDELHHKTALFLVSNFDIIFIPKFETRQMAKKGRRRIRAKSVRSMLTFAHYRFQEFLKAKALEYGKHVININEAYTSKTCSWNGKIKNIGSAKYIKDENIVVDRDYNGARGILLRALRELAIFIAYTGDRNTIPNVATKTLGFVNY